MLRVARILVVVIVGVLATRCGDTIINNTPTQPSTAGTSTTSTMTKIEYRVSGNASSARVRYSNEQDGLIQTVTTLPFFTTVTTTQDSAFVSLEVTPLSYPAIVTAPFLSAQIFVNGNLFREATSNEFILNTIAVNGTWRK
jgi:hypothetical protein